jgi:hypothetical protein
MMAIGHDYKDIKRNQIVCCQDTDFINHCSLVGVVDVNGIVWEPYWSSNDNLVRVDTATES